MVGFRISKGLLAVLLTALTAAIILSTVAIAEPDGKPVAPNPNFFYPGGWPTNTLWGTNLQLEDTSHIVYYNDAWFGVKTGTEYLFVHETPPDAFSIGIIFLGKTWGYEYQEIVRAQNDIQAYRWYLYLLNELSSRDMIINAVLENDTHNFIPLEFSVVLENRANGIFIDLRSENRLFNLTSGRTFAVLYIDNFVPKVNVSVAPSNEWEGEGKIGYTVTVTSLAENLENLDALAPSSFSYELNVSDNLGWGLELADNFLDNIRPGHSKMTTLTVMIPENAEFGIKDNVVVTAISRTDPWVGDNASFPAFVPNFITGWNLVGFTAVGESDTPHNIFGLDYNDNYYLYYWNAPNGPYTMQDPYQLLNDNTGYWVWVNQAMLIETSGTPQASENIHLVAGWNLVGFPVVDANTTPDNIFAPLNYYDNYIIYYWNAPGGPYGLQGSNTVLKDNTGYLVWIDRDWTVTVP